MRYSLLFLASLAACSGCHIGQYPLTPQIAEAGTYLVYNDRGSGTAWAVNAHQLVTAGHICEQMNDNVVLVSTTNRKFHGKIRVWDKSDGDYNQDLCLIDTSFTLPSPLNLAPEMPVVGQDIGYVGFPDGVYSAHTGVYQGDTDGPDNNEQNYSFSAWTNHGASGSALYDDRGVWGVLVRLKVTPEGEILTPEDGGVAIPLDVITSFLDDAGAKYTVTPLPIEKPMRFK
jgi:S1-C subfamily serine protease